MTFLYDITPLRNTVPGPIGWVDDVIGAIVGLGLDILAVGTIVVSIKPAFEAIKSQSWSDFPMISVPILISSWFLFGPEHRVSGANSPLSLGDQLLTSTEYIIDVGGSFSARDEWDEEEADTGGYY
tara:strand:+ start:248 stop:625 length:378 start_codon:yes stop_codon:yes gene_type:complete